MTPRVTVGIPFFDEARHLGDAIRSVLAQTVTDFELLLVDDGSRDDSLRIARSFDDPRIVVVADGTRRHLPARLNEIVQRAHGTYVARMDADDVMHPTRIARQLALLDAQPACDAVGTWAALVDDAGDVFGVIESGPLPPSAKSGLTETVVPHASLLARRAWFVGNPYDETMTRAEDRDLWCRTALTTKFDVVPECLYVVRVDPNKRSFLASYLDGQRQNRVLYTKYGPAALGRVETVRLLASAHAKSLMMQAAVAFGFGQRLVRRRGRSPSAAERALALEALAVAQRPY